MSELRRPLEGPGSEARLFRLQRGLRAVSGNSPVSRARKRDRFAGIVVLAGLATAIAATLLLGVTDDPVSMRIKHYMVVPGCGFAEVFELAPARAGRPGYWSWLDHDKDGWACEAYRTVTGKIERR